MKTFRTKWRAITELTIQSSQIIFRKSIKFGLISHFIRQLKQFSSEFRAKATFTMLALIVVIAHFAVMKRECLHSSLVSFILFYSVNFKPELRNSSGRDFQNSNISKPMLYSICILSAEVYVVSSHNIRPMKRQTGTHSAKRILTRHLCQS